MGDFKRIDAEQEREWGVRDSSRSIQRFGDTATGLHAKRILTLSDPNSTDEQVAKATYCRCRACDKWTMNLVEFKDDEHWPAFCADCLRAALALLEPGG